MRYAAERRNLDESIEELRQIADRPTTSWPAGLTAGFWCASPATHVGFELICAGMLILAGDGVTGSRLITTVAALDEGWL